MISQPIFESQFKKTWALLEPYDPKPEKIGAYYDILKFSHPGYVTRAFGFFAKANRHEKGGVSFPTGPVFLERVKIFEQQDKARPPALPVNTDDLTEAEIEAEYELIAGFIEAYPHPGYPAKASSREGDAVDLEYFNRMRRAGIKDIHGLTHPEVGKRLMADLMKKLNF
jgi:hypothetical protein